MAKKTIKDLRLGDIHNSIRECEAEMAIITIGKF